MRKPNGYGGVVKASGKRRNPYQVRITTGFETVMSPDGELKTKQKFQIIGSYPTYQEANLALALYNNNPYDPTLQDITFEKAYTLAIKARQPLSQNTLKGYKNAYNKLEKLYRKKILKIRKTDLQQAIDTQETEATQKQMISLFHIVFEWAEKDIELIKNNPSANLKVTVQAKGKRQGKPYTADEIKLLWRNLHTIRFVDTVLIQIYTGVRVSEMLSIKKEDVHLEERWITINGTKTENAARMVPIRNEIVPLLKARMEAAKSDYVFVSPKRQKRMDLTYYSVFFDDIRKTLNLDHVTHDARHTFISRADDCSMNSNALKFIVGHSLKDITGKVYTHKDVANLVSEMDKIKFF